jgi:hypothetical protein
MGCLVGQACASAAAGAVSAAATAKPPNTALKVERFMKPVSLCIYVLKPENFSHAMVHFDERNACHRCGCYISG